MIVLFGVLLSLVAPSSGSSMDWIMKVFCVGVFFWIAMVNIGDWDHIMFDKDKRTIRISRTNVFGQTRVYVHGLELLSGVDIVDGSLRADALVKSGEEAATMQADTAVQQTTATSSQQLKSSPSKYRIVLHFEDNIEMPLTEMLYATKGTLEGIVKTIETFITGFQSE